MKIGRLKAGIVLGAIVASLVGGVAPSASAATCNRTAIWMPRPIGHHTLPQVDYGLVECECPPPPTYIDVQLYGSAVIITSCIMT